MANPQVNYDMEWLKNQHFWLDVDNPEGDTVEGPYESVEFLEMGASHAVFAMVGPDGRKLAMKVLVPRFAFYLRELPPGLRTDPPRDPARLNRKLAGLIGDPLMDHLVRLYETFYGRLVTSLFEGGIDDFEEWAWTSERSQILMDFVTRTPGLRYRVEQWATGSEDADEQRSAWAARALASLDRIGPDDHEVRPGDLLDNPFYLWAGAAAEGFLEEEEIRAAVAFLRDRYRTAETNPDVDLWLAQCWYVGSLLQDLFDEAPEVEAFVDFQNRCAAELDPPDPDG